MHAARAHKCHVTKASEGFKVGRNQCIVCRKTYSCTRNRRTRQTVDGRLRHLYSGCKHRHKKHTHEGELITFERFKAVYLAQDGVCVETGAPFGISNQSKDPIQLYQAPIELITMPATRGASSDAGAQRTTRDKYGASVGCSAAKVPGRLRDDRLFSRSWSTENGVSPPLPTNRDAARVAVCW